MEDYQKLVKRSDGYTFLKDKETGKLLAVDSPGYENPAAIRFEQLERVMVDEMVIDTRTWIACTIYSSVDNFFAEQADDIIGLMQNFGEWTEVTLCIDEEYLADLQIAKKVLTMSTTPPGQGKPLSGVDE